jgi:hypothetical protein
MTKQASDHAPSDDYGDQHEEDLTPDSKGRAPPPGAANGVWCIVLCSFRSARIPATTAL